MIDIVVLTLKSSTERRKKFKERHAKYLKFRFHFGVDTEQMAATEYLTLMQTERYTFMPSYILSPGEVACVKGHWNILKNFVAGHSPSDFLLVLEDDVYIPPEVPPLLNKIAEVVDDGIVILGGDKRLKSNLIFGRTVQKFADGKRLRLVSRWCRRSIKGTCCYMVSYGVAEKLLLSYEKHNLLGDDWVRRMWVGNIKKMYFSHLIKRTDNSADSLLERWKKGMEKFLLGTVTGKAR